MLAYFLYFITGALAGTMAGLLGIGGGLVVVPGLAFVFIGYGLAHGAVMHMAAGTSLASMIVTAIASVRSHNRRGAVLWDIFFRMLPGVIIGTIIGAIIASLLSTTTLRIIFGIFLLIISIRMFMLAKPKIGRAVPGNFIVTLVALAIGGKSGLLGVGGGALSVPFLTFCNVPMRNASGTSAAIGLPIAITGAISFIITGWHVVGLPPMSVGYVYLPAAIAVAIASVLFVPFGAKLSHWLPVPTIKRIFALVLMATSLNLLYGALF